MKMTRFSALALAMAVLAGPAGATGHGDDWTNPFDHATRPELASAVKTLNAADAKETAARIEGDKANAAATAAETKGRKDADTQLGYEINTQAKYTTSVNEDLQASKAAGAAAYNQIQGQIGATNGAVKAVDDKVNTAIGVQSGINSHLQSGINDAKGAAVNAQATADVAVGLGQKGINDAYNAQQTANTAVGIGQDAKNTAINAQNTADYAVGQGQKNANDIINTNATVAGNKAAQDKVNTAQANTNTQVQGQIKAVDGKADSALGLAGQANTVATVAYQNSVTNDKNIRSVATVVDAQGKQIATETKRNDFQDLQITNLGNNAVTQDGQIRGLQKDSQAQAATNKVQDQRLDGHDATLNEYGQRIGGVEQSVANIDTAFRQYGAQMSQFDNRLNKVEKKADRADEASVIALAVAGHQFNTDLEAGFQVALSGATNGNKQGVAFGAGGAVTKNVFLNIGIGTAGSTTGGVVSATYAFGR